MNWSKDLIAASAIPLILSVLDKGESYGYAIIKHVAELTDDEMVWTDGMLYPVLHRMEKKGMIKSEWRTAESGRKRKYYSINSQGKMELKNEKRKWAIINTALIKLWEEKHV